jgi:hypothetical protein
MQEVRGTTWRQSMQVLAMALSLSISAGQLCMAESGSQAPDFSSSWQDSGITPLSDLVNGNILPATHGITPVSALEAPTKTETNQPTALQNKAQATNTGLKPAEKASVKPEASSEKPNTPATVTKAATTNLTALKTVPNSTSKPSGTITAKNVGTPIAQNTANKEKSVKNTSTTANSKPGDKSNLSTASNNKAVTAPASNNKAAVPLNAQNTNGMKKAGEAMGRSVAGEHPVVKAPQAIANTQKAENTEASENTKASKITMPEKQAVEIEPATKATAEAKQEGNPEKSLTGSEKAASHPTAEAEPETTSETVTTPLVENPQKTVLEAAPVESSPQLRLDKKVESASGKATKSHSAALIQTQAKPSVTQALQEATLAQKKAKENAAMAEAQAKADKIAQKEAEKEAKRNRLRAAQMKTQKPLVVMPIQSNSAATADSGQEEEAPTLRLSPARVTFSTPMPVKMPEFEAAKIPQKAASQTADNHRTDYQATPVSHMAQPPGNASQNGNMDSSEATSDREPAATHTSNPETGIPVMQTPSTASQTKNNAPMAAEKPAVHQPGSKLEALGNILNPFYDEHAIKPVSYQPLSGIAIFPVLKSGDHKAFADVSVLFAREYAERMELKVPDTKIYNPVYTVDELRLRGLGHVYDKIVDYYSKAGRPEPTATDYLLKQLSSDGKPISRVIFVEANVDMNAQDTATSVIERVQGLMSDGTPKQSRAFVRTRIQMYDAESPNLPMVWGGSWNRTVKMDSYYNVTPSVFAESDSQQAFAKVSRQMSREMIYVMPKEAYMIPVYDTSVQGRLAGPDASETTFPNFTEAKASPNRVSEENKKAIQRILQRQNSISP